MTIRNRIVPAALSAFALVTQVDAVAASEVGRVEVMKPIQGIVFETGQEHAVGYFYPDAGRCKLVLTLAAEPNWDGAESLFASRLESRVAAGRSIRYTSDGRAFEFHCQDGAQAMTFQRLSVVTDAD